MCHNVSNLEQVNAGKHETTLVAALSSHYLTHACPSKLCVCR